MAGADQAGLACLSYVRQILEGSYRKENLLATHALL